MSDSPAEECLCPISGLQSSFNCVGVSDVVSLPLTNISVVKYDFKINLHLMMNRTKVILQTSCSMK